MGSEHYCLRWNNHQSNLLGVFSQLLRDESLVDVTLACSEGHSIRAHKVVLSACSSYFQTLFVDHPSRHPIVILKDVRFSELRTLVEFMYKGEVNVEYCQLSALLKTAESLKVKGLAEMTNLSSSKDDHDQHQHQQQQSQHQEQTPQPSQTVNLSTDMDMDTESEQTEPTELVNKRLKEDTNSTANESPPPAPLSLRRRSDPQQKTENDSRPHSTESIRPDSPESDVNSTPHTSCGPSDMSMNSSTNNNNNNTISSNNNATVTSCSATLPGGLIGTAPVCSRLPSPHSTEPVAGPSGMPPIQQVPLSLKKEVDWSSTSFGEEKAECSSEYNRHSHESDLLSGVVGGLANINSGEALCLDQTATASAASTNTTSMALELERCFGSPMVEHPSTTSAHSSRSSTPFAFPFPTFPGTGSSSNLDETSSRLLGLLHPALLGTTAAAAAAAAACAAAASASASAEDATFRCPVCLAAFPSLWLLEQHTALQHLALGHFGADDKPFVCDQCGQSYRYRSAYIKHREQNHRARLPADKLFSCDVCGMQFRYLKSFKKHRLNHALERLHGKTDIHVNTDSGHVSNNYDSDAPVSENGNTENPDKKEDTTTESGSNQVSSSSNETTTTTDPTIPQITIKKEVTYPDDGTENMSTDSEKLTSAKSDLDQDDTIDSIAFSLTGVGSSSGTIESRSVQEASILSFLRMDAAERQRERRFACPFCGKCVRSKENLKLHVRKHTGERPFVCLFCGRAFGGKSDLTRHLRIHTGERPYHCEMCGKCFARADYLSKHLTTHIHTPR